MNKKIKIALLIDVLRGVAGGAERQVYELLRGANGEKYEFFVFVLHHKQLPQEVQGLVEIEGIRCSAQGLGIKRIYDIRGIVEGFRFLKFLKKEKVSVLMTYHFSSDIWGAILGKLAGVPVIISNRRDEGFWRNRAHIIAYKLVNRWVNKVIVVSNAVKEMVLKEGVPEDRVELIYNGVDSKRFGVDIGTIKKKRELDLPADSMIIGCVGNLKTVKGHKFLIEAVQKVVREYPNTHFLIIGANYLKENPESIVKGLNLEKNIHFLGIREDVPELLKICDICVLPSLSEGLSNVLLEYMAAGKPVIATAVGGNLDVIEHEKNGILVPPKDSISLENQIIRLLENKDFAKSLGIQARKTVVEKFNLQNQIKQMEEFLENELLKKKAPEKAQKETKLLHLISSSGLFGAEQVLLKVAKSNNKTDITSIVGAINNRHNPHLEIVDKAEIIGLKTVIFNSKGKYDISTIRQIAHFIKENKIEIIHTHNYKSDIIGFFAAKITGIKWVATNHNWIGRSFKEKFYEMLDAFILNFANKIIAVSDRVRSDSIKKGINEHKIKKIYNGIDASEFDFKHPTSKLKNELGLTNGGVVITTVGRLSPEKGHKVFLEAAEKVTKKINNVKFLIVGDGPLKNSLQSTVHSRQMEKYVKFLGVRDDIAQIFSISDIYVNPSYVEGIPIAVLEAMSAHLPVVATRAGGTPQIISDNYNGILADCGDAEGLANNISSLITDGNRRKKLAEQAYKDICEKFSSERMGRDYSDVYQEVLT